MLQGKLARDFDVAWSHVDCIDSGVTKHEAKEYARAMGAKSWHDVGQEIGVYKIETLDDYKLASYQAVDYIKENFGIRDVRQIDGHHVGAWLESKIGVGVKYSTISSYASAMGKFSTALEKWTGKEYDWSSNIKEAREIGRATLGYEDCGRRAFDSPEAVKSQLSPRFEVYAKTQLECGCRISEINTITIRDDRVYVTGKGSYEREIFPSNELKAEFKEKIEAFGTVGMDTKAEMDAYRNDLKQACEATGEQYTGSHAFRHNYAEKSFQKALGEGKSYNEALKETSERLGHHREDVVEKYYLKD